MAARRVLIHCNASITTGMGHLMRSLALAEEATARGWDVRIVGDISDEARSRARKQQPALNIESVPPEHLADTLRSAHEHTDVVHLDSYDAVADLAATSALISNMQDGPFGLRPADLAIDANLGSETWFARPDWSRNHLAGVDAAAIRRQVLQQRRRPRRTGVKPRVLVVMGGTDPHHLSPRIAAALAATPSALEATVIAPEAQHESIRTSFAGTSHTVKLRTFINHLPAVAYDHDFVISAAGSSVWDFACMGVPMAIVCVVDNQQRGYRAAINAEIAIGLGEPPHPDLTERIAALPALITDTRWLLSRTEHLRRVVDGRGAWRIISAWEELTTNSTPPQTRSDTTLTARPAHEDDAQMLFAWRNDESTRSHSRSRAPLSWDTHTAWLDTSLANPNRILLIVQNANTPVATIRWDKQSKNDWEVSITVAPSHRGHGLSRAVLVAGENALHAEDPVRMLAIINTANAASRRLFQRAGYLPHLPADENGFETRAKWRLVSGH